MQDTIGTVGLKIARLQQQLRLLQQQQRLGQGYPDLQADLTRRQLMVEYQLTQLMRSREELQHGFQSMAKETFNGELYGPQPLCAAN